MRQKKQLFEITKIIQTCAYPNSRPALRIYYGMKKIITVLILALITLIPLGGCKKKINYADYISEKRTNIYVYEDDTRSVKIHCSQREQPYAADGIKGAMNGICEIFVTLDKNPQELYAEINGHRELHRGGFQKRQRADNAFRRRKSRNLHRAQRFVRRRFNVRRSARLRNRARQSAV